MRKTKRYMALPYNQNLKKRARELRRAGLLHEALLWNQLKRKSFRGLDFDRQKIIGNYIVDFFCAEKGVVIEADGASHDGKDVHDAQRDDHLRALGLTVIRISAKDILQDMEGVLGLLGQNEALVGEAEPPRPSGTPPTEGNW